MDKGQNHKQNQREQFKEDLLVSFIATFTPCLYQRWAYRLLVERLGVSGGGGDVSVTGSLVGASRKLQSGGSVEVSRTSGVVGLSVASDEVESKSREHCEWVA